MNSLWWLQFWIVAANSSPSSVHEIIDVLRPSDEVWRSHDLFDSLGDLLRKRIRAGLIEMRWLEYILPGCGSNDMVMVLLHYLGSLDPAEIGSETGHVVVVDGTYPAPTNFDQQTGEAEENGTPKLEPFDLDIALHDTESHCRHHVPPLLMDVLSNCDLLDERGIKVVWFESGRRTDLDLTCASIVGSKVEMDKAVKLYVEEYLDGWTPPTDSGLEETSSMMSSKWGYAFAFWNGVCAGIVLDRLASMAFKRCCPKEQPPPPWSYLTSHSAETMADKASNSCHGSRPAMAEKTWDEIMSFEQHLRANRGGSSAKTSRDSGGSRSLDSIMKSSPAFHKTRRPSGKRRHTHHHHHHHPPPPPHRRGHSLKPSLRATSEPHDKRHSSNPYPIIQCSPTLLAAYKNNAVLRHQQGKL
eukprot:Protomagalhaensia_sp_Gyna_25__1433@NODE_1724_length_1586_cov_65_978668_g1413_i0_p1_GENE_NODE_1724_length_1586_cov_65_978668_g1413_i0NODE_1724_length_1586_cov_65_978668_g1413_i0_p1_ORF_typecomplete_len413_score43_48DUF4266/PF14086_6/0_29_NODE_1724_length_1586_cov_65_978668_g1413_i0901328